MNDITDTIQSLRAAVVDAAKHAACAACDHTTCMAVRSLVRFETRLAELERRLVEETHRVSSR